MKRLNPYWVQEQSPSPYVRKFMQEKPGKILKVYEFFKFFDKGEGLKVVRLIPIAISRADR